MLEYLSRYLGDLWAAINWLAANRRKVPRPSASPGLGVGIDVHGSSVMLDRDPGDLGIAAHALPGATHSPDRPG